MQPVLGALDMLNNVGFVHGEDHDHTRGIGAVVVIVGRKQMRAGDDDRADLMKRHHRIPELVAALEHQHDGIAFPYAQRGKNVGRFVG
ncbi:hypothetical protein SDC9_189855 [bioreactor metagenome]|uniref:Uncharacterized protein n=1 Tax=bioreactor metagenome TaxID=1076179 RepID=A0A645HTC5_9ZZZZ